MKAQNATRVTQHKGRREDAKGKELSDLKKENASLRRQNARLNKQLSKVSHIIHDQEEKAIEKELKTATETTSNQCGSCGSTSLGTLKLPTGTIFVSCKLCGWRHKK